MGVIPEPIDMLFGVMGGVPDLIIHAKFYSNRLRGFSAAAPRIMSNPVLICCITVQTVMPTFVSIGYRRQHPEKYHFLYFFVRLLQQFFTTVQTVIKGIFVTMSDGLQRSPSFVVLEPSQRRRYTDIMSETTNTGGNVDERRR